VTGGSGSLRPPAEGLDVPAGVSASEPLSAEPPAVAVALELAPESGIEGLLSSPQPATEINTEIKIVDAFTLPMWIRCPNSAQRHRGIEPDA
jgi:hypothetical protein